MTPDLTARGRPCGYQGRPDTTLQNPLEDAVEEPRVFVVVSAPAGDDPEATAQELALTVQKAVPGADVYTSTTTKEVS